MKMMITSMNLFMLMAPFLKHPVSLGSLLLLQSIFTALITVMMMKNSWFAFILFITFSGGLMIMFIYMSSIASNEKFKFSIKIMLMMILSITILMLMMNDKTMIFQTKWMETNLFYQSNEEKLSIIKFLTSNKKYLSIMLILIILLNLISVTNIVNSFEGPLKKTYENNI